jgi:NAD+ synthase
MQDVDVDRILSFIRDVVGDTPRVIIGVSGGVDSAVCLHLCCRALGPDRVMAVYMPAAITPKENMLVACREPMRFGAQTSLHPVGPTVAALTATFGHPVTTTAEGNLTARVRMCLLYLYANQYNGMVCGTGNRTEYYLGYTTKWGDNAADFYPILHLYKTEVWDLARTLGVSQTIIDRPPSAGLWDGQTDEGEIGMSYATMDTSIRSLLDPACSGRATPEMTALHTRHLRNAHKSTPGRSLLCSQ